MAILISNSNKNYFMDLLGFFLGQCLHSLGVTEAMSVTSPLLCHLTALGILINRLNHENSSIVALFKSLYNDSSKLNCSLISASSLSSASCRVVLISGK